MYYCSDDKYTWASPRDLYDRFGDEFMDKISTRMNYSQTLKMYVADEKPESRLKVIQLALDDAKELIVRKLSCKFQDVILLNTHYFSSIKSWHIKLTIETLKIGGDCTACECNADLDKFIDCNTICTEDGICLPSASSFFLVSQAKSECECQDKCGCC